jgi:hypothetical protein
MRTLVIGLLSIFVGWELAAEAVKTYSGLCRKENRRGSAALFQAHHKVYVVSSEHVFAHSKDPKFCHWMQSQSQGRQRLELLSVDVASGLALLRPVDSRERPQLTLEDFVSPDEDSVISVEAYPALSQKKARSTSASPFLLASDREIFPASIPLFEIAASGEFGMSGGPAWQASSPGDKVAGILSHKVVLDSERGATRLSDASAETWAKASSLVVIDGAYVRQWIETEIAALAQSEELRRGTFASLESENFDSARALVSGGVLYRWVAAPSRAPGDKKKAVGGDPVGIGGDPVGIGGDPVGIGGRSGPDSRGHLLVERVGSELKLPRLLESLEKHLLLDRKVEVIALSDGRHRRGLSSLAAFFALAAKEPAGLRPVLRSRPFDDASFSMRLGTERLVQKMLGQLTELHKEKFAERLSKAEDQVFLAELVEYMKVFIESAQLGELSDFPFELQRELSEQPGWRGLYTLNFDFAVELRRSFLEIGEQQSR